MLKKVSNIVITVIQIIAIAVMAINTVVFLIHIILELLGRTAGLPPYMHIEMYCTAAVMAGVAWNMKRVQALEDRNQKRFEKLTAHRNAVYNAYRLQLRKNIELFRINNQLTEREAGKFQRIVNYTLRDLEKEDRQQEAEVEEIEL